jgi:two-component system phosphate regulon sensor histidine kinase PhoR
VPRLTERFYRVDRGRSRNTGGTGLGLAIVKHVLIRHQAELEIRSEPGVGSAFAVRLPARRVHPVAVPSPGDAGDAPAGAHAGGAALPGTPS